MKLTGIRHRFVWLFALVLLVFSVAGCGNAPGEVCRCANCEIDELTGKCCCGDGCKGCDK